MPLPRANHDQDRRFAQAFAVLVDGVQRRAFPGAAVAVTWKGELVAHKGVGRFTYAADSPALAPETPYDLASLTKVVATTAMAMKLHDQSRFDLEQPLAEVVPEFVQCDSDSRRNAITMRMLLAHGSGLPGYARLFEQANGPDEMLMAACRTALVADPGMRAEYSDPGFMLLGVALERLAGEGLDTFCRREIWQPLEMSRTCFCPAESHRREFPPTEDDQAVRMRVMQGEVHDENAHAMGGIAGHAGVFAPAEDVALFAECMLRRGAPVFPAHTVETFTRRQPPPGSSRALGWDTPSTPSQSGRYFSPRSFGHLGFTGTSLWIDPERQLSVTLLTNRTWPDRSSEMIKELRPRFHDATIEALA